MSVRKIRYYSQIGILSPPEIVNGKKKYTKKHLQELKTAKIMQKSGAKLNDIKGMIQSFDVEKLKNVSEQMNYLSKEKLLETEMKIIDSDVSIFFHHNISTEKKHEIIETLKKISKKYE